MKSSASSASNSNDQLQDLHENNTNQNKKLVVSEEVRKKYRFISIAQELVMAARGKLVDRNWKRRVPVENGHSNQKDSTASSEQPQTHQVPATIDDISVFVIPILAYKEEYMQWKENRFRACSSDATRNNGVASSENNQKTAHDNMENSSSDSTKRMNANSVNGNMEKGENPFSDTSDSDLELDNTTKTEDNSTVTAQVSNSKPSTSERNTNSSLDLHDDLSIEEALDAIIQEEDLSNSKTTLEIKETDDEIEVSDEDNEAERK